MKLTTISERMGYLGKKPTEKRNMILLGDAYSIWKLLILRYDALITSKILIDCARDEELKKIIGHGIEVLEVQKNKLESLMKEFCIPMPERPPEDYTGAMDGSSITDKMIYREIFNGMANTMFKHISNFQRTNSSYLREIFRAFLEEEMDLYDKYFEYGKLKAYLHESPAFRV